MSGKGRKWEEREGVEGLVMKVRGEEKMGAQFIGVSCKCTPKQSNPILEDIFAGLGEFEGGSG